MILNLTRLSFLKAVFSGGCQYDPPSTFHEELIKCQYVYFQQGNVKKYKKLMETVNTGKENLHIFRTTYEILMKFSEKMCLTIILKVKKKQGFTPSLVNTVSEKPQGDQIDPPPSLLRIKKKFINFFNLNGETGISKKELI